MPKTKDAFALRCYFVDKPLCDLSNYYKMSEQDNSDYLFETLPKMSNTAVEALERLDKMHRRILIRHFTRLDKYLAELAQKIAQSDIVTAQMKSKIERATILKSNYENLLWRINDTRETLRNLIKDNELIERRLVLKDFSARLRQARKEAGLTQAKIAAQIGMGQNRYTLYETARREPSLATLIRLSRVLKRPTDWLLGLTP